LISGVSGEGVQDALRELAKLIGEAPVSAKAKAVAAKEPEPVGWTPLPR
jgi:GTP-binding protein